MTSSYCQVSAITLTKSDINWLKLISWANNNFVDAKVILEEFQRKVVSILVCSTRQSLTVDPLKNNLPSVFEVE